MKLFKKVAVSFSASALLAAGGLAVAAGDAHAATLSPMGQTLCSNTSQCGLDVPMGVHLTPPLAGQVFNANVTGQKGKAISVRAWAIEWTSATAYKAAPLSNVVTATPVGNASASYGYIQVQLTATNPPAGFSGGHVTVQPADWKPGMGFVPTQWISGNADSGKKVNDFEIFTNRVSDDGFSETGTFQDVFHRTGSAGIPGHKYSVQVYWNGKWVTIDNAGPGTVSSSGTLVVQARVPDALPAGKWRTRLINLTSKIYDISPDQPYVYFTINAFDVYTEEGYWDYNGRKWHTTCEPYSATERCRTEIWATTVQYINGAFVSKAGYVFNNLTYKPSPRSLWTKNPLGAYGKVGGTAAWTAADGSKWKTECDTAGTGRGACRSFRWTQVIASTKTSSGYSYKFVAQWVFNNIVRFS